MSPLAGIESMLLPVMIMLFFSGNVFNITYAESIQRLTTMCHTLIFMLSLNTIWIIIGLSFDLSLINQYFWGSLDTTVASLAATNGRYSGIFNQPMESGVVYSLGLFAWLFIVEKAKKLNFKHIILLVILLAGGAMSVSKVFLFGGLLLFILGLLSSKQIKKRPFKLIFGIFIILTPTYVFLSNNWRGMDRLLGYFNPNQLSLGVVTAGRFGESSQQSSLFADVWKSDPLLGLGFGSSEVYDSAYFYFFANGGILAMSLYIVTLFAMFYATFKYSHVKGTEAEVRMLFLIVILIVGGGIGAPILVLNRASTVVWVFLGLLLQQYNIRIAEKENRSQEVIHNKKSRRIRYKITW